MSSLRLRLTGSIQLDLLRKTQGSYVDGIWVAGTEDVVTIAANIQPLKEAELAIMPEADRTKVWLKLYSPSPIRTDKQGTDGHDADQFVFEGDRFKVMKVEHYSMGVQDHYKAVAARVEISAK